MAFAPEYRFIDLDFVIFLHLIVIVNIVKQKKRKYRPVPITQYIERNSDILRFHFLNSVKFQLIDSIENDLLCFFLQIKVRNTHTQTYNTCKYYRSNQMLFTSDCINFPHLLLTATIKRKEKWLRKSTNRMSTKKPIW